MQVITYLSSLASSYGMKQTYFPSKQIRSHEGTTWNHLFMARARRRLGPRKSSPGFFGFQYGAQNEVK